MNRRLFLSLFFLLFLLPIQLFSMNFHSGEESRIIRIIYPSSRLGDFMAPFTILINQKIKIVLNQGEYAEVRVNPDEYLLVFGIEDFWLPVHTVTPFLLDMGTTDEVTIKMDYPIKIIDNSAFDYSDCTLVESYEELEI